MLALKLFVIANFLFKSSHSAEAELRKEYILKRFKFNSTRNWPVGQRSLFDTPLWPDSALEILDQASSHYDHFSPKVTSSPEELSKPSEVPNENEQDCERLKGNIGFELDLNVGLEQNDSESNPRGISHLLLAADMIKSNDIAGEVSKPKSTRPDAVLLKHLRKDLDSKFKSQHPQASYSLRNYNVENWPEGVDMFKTTWNKQEIEAIRSKMDDFVFTKREVPFDFKTEFGVSDLSDLEDVLDHSMSKLSTNEFLLNRFREETGNLEAKRIDWSLLDRRDIPSRYEDCVLNGKSMSHCSIFYKNPEIVYNIHFSSKNENSKRNERVSRVDDDSIRKKQRSR